MLNSIEPGPDRWKLGFKEAVLSCFDFLRSYGLQPVQEEATFVRYESNSVFIDIHHGRGSYEIGAEIGRLDRPEKYGLDYIVSRAGNTAWETEGFGKHTMFQVSSREGVQEFVPKVAELVKKYGAPFLRGDVAFYDELGEDNKRAVLEFARQQQLKDIRKSAELAWHAKDYGQVVELYGPVRKDLTEVEAKKLAYAEQQILAAEGVGSRSSSRKKR